MTQTQTQAKDTRHSCVMLPYLEGVYIFSGTDLYTQELQQ